MCEYTKQELEAARQELKREVREDLAHSGATGIKDICYTIQSRARVMGGAAAFTDLACRARDRTFSKPGERAAVWKYHRTGEEPFAEDEYDSRVVEGPWPKGK